MITIRNKGHLEIDLLTTMGAHVKETDNAYGQFGTGMKYAIATLMRNGINFDLCIGENVYQFYAEQKAIRGKEFKMCHMHGKFDRIPLGFTTELGKNWLPWQAYRELYTNAIFDELEGECWEGDMQPMEGYTMFRIYDDIETEGVFLRDMNLELLYASDDVDIYQGKSDYIYYQGVRAKDLHSKKSLFTYNIKSYCTITEDRSIAYDFQVNDKLAKAIVGMDANHDGTVARILNAKNTFFESRIDFTEANGNEPSETFTTVFRNSPETKRNASANHYMGSFAPISPPQPADLRKEFLASLSDLCDDYGVEYEIRDDIAMVKLP